MQRALFVPLAISGFFFTACGGNSFDGFSRTAEPASDGGSGSATSQSSGGGGAGGATLRSGTANPPRGAAGAAGAANDAAQPDASGGAPDVAAADAGASCTPELCNGKDDDCDGTVDEGCPAGFSLGNALQRPSVGDSPGGTVFADACADDELMVGLNVAVGGWLEQVAAICAKYSLHVNTEPSPYQYSLALSGERSLLAHPPSATSAVQELACRGGTVLVGVRVSQQHSAYGQSDDIILIPKIWITCAEPKLNLSSSTARVEWQNAVEVGPVTGTVANDSAWFEADLLGTTELVTGLHGGSGGWVDRVGLTSSPLAILLQAE
ncbi:MAG TPA: putative metal-binding motif-containing protein [Polyangiaceae bacterium]|jgi:hypothetical protein|nr:putative metal-binding motif-containing protein [Polyangiaceae bacterium]